jgi:hypothetical protein
MKTRQHWLDRLRIERAVWTVDALTQAAPDRARRAIRRELRANLQAAAAQMSAKEAVRQLGDLRQLALGYVEAQYGPGNLRPRWLRGVCWALGTEVVLLALTFATHSAFIAGVQAGNPRPNGTYSWPGLHLLGIGGNVTFHDGSSSAFSLSFSLWILLYLLAALVLGGQLWRLPVAWWRNRHQAVGQR